MTLKQNSSGAVVGWNLWDEDPAFGYATHFAFGGEKGQPAWEQLPPQAGEQVSLSTSTPFAARLVLRDDNRVTLSSDYSPAIPGCTTVARGTLMH